MFLNPGMEQGTKYRSPPWQSGSVVDPKLFNFFISGCGSYIDLNIGSGFGTESGFGLFMKNTFEMQIIYTSQKSKFFFICTFLDPDCLEIFI